MNITNKHLDNIDVDHFHHLGFSTKDIALENFKDVKIVCVCGSPERVKKLAGFLNDGLKLVKAEEIHNLCSTDRYVMFKLGPILLASHGIGAPSASILFHEIFKLLHYSEAKEFVFFRLGTCGGLGVKPGTIVLTKKALNGFLQPVYTQTVLGKKFDYPTIMDNTIIEELQHLVQENSNFDVISGDTFCCDDFYEAQARLDGAFCTYSKQDKEDFLTMLQSNGVKNIEMESSVVAAMCNRANIRACTMCVVLVDRLAEDQVILTNEMRKEIEKKPWYLLLEYIKRKIAPVRPDN
ncbi:uridine phosphorylase 2 isoform X1 [Hydra vulgaris]|uniref:Uridine phosphorylase 2 n=1 Tax=Hydra vulgaris TaxID=6087 RepID=T2MIE0_HYDVU|nr:uridine phosphorylase 2 [Hydra vulgaris]